MLEKLILHNFKSHKYTELNFDNSRLHGIVGKNSAGKNSVLQAIYSLSMLIYSSSTQIFKKENLPQFITTMGEKRMSITASGYWQDNIRKKWKFFYSSYAIAFPKLTFIPSPKNSSILILFKH
ncbi:AAA family ATPase [Anabaena sp. WFMT]|uniref:AAA family ATPase n=1 Tax=Anabaena sp. WFMT TaxID=3449730 RepID=UPI003F28FBDA